MAERVLEGAASQVLQEEDLGDIRDRVRRYKETLGRNILHPRVLATAVAYKVAMWNRVAAEIDSSRAIEQLADSLLDLDASQPLPVVESGEAVSELLTSKSFERLLAALQARVTGSANRDVEAKWIIDALELESLRAEEVAAFSGEEADEATRLMRAALLVGLLMRRRSALDDALRVLEIDPDTLATECVDSLVTRMSELARVRFAEGNYGLAFRLSEVKTHSLSPHAVRRSPSSSDALDARSPAPSVRSVAMYRFRELLEELPSWPVVLAFMLVLGVVLLPSLASRHEEEIAKRQELARISPFLEWGRNVGEGENRSFAGHLGRTWDYLDTEERHRIATEIGEHFARLGTRHVVLKDVHRRIVVEYKDHAFKLLVPRGYGEAELP